MRASGLVLVSTLLVPALTLAQSQGTPSEWTTPSTYGPTEPPPPPADAPPQPPAEPAYVPPAPPPPVQPAPSAPPPVEVPRASSFRPSFHLLPGLGVTTFAVSDAWAGWGAVLEGVGEFQFNPYVGLRLRAAWGLTEWDRAMVMINHGLAAGSWTAGAYSTVGNWLATDTKYALLKFLPALFAFVFLSVGFVYAGLVLVLSPLAATSYVQVGLAASGHLPLDNGVDLYAEAGLGSMLYWHPRTQFVRMAFGPTLGVGVTVRRVSVGVHGLWSPPVMQSNPSNAPDVVAASITARYVY